MINEPLNPEQIENWRKVLSLTLGRYAFVMSDSEVQAARDRYQNDLDRTEKSGKAERKST